MNVRQFSSVTSFFDHYIQSSVQFNSGSEFWLDKGCPLKLQVRLRLVLESKPSSLAEVFEGDAVGLSVAVQQHARPPCSPVMATASAEHSAVPSTTP